MKKSHITQFWAVADYFRQVGPPCARFVGAAGADRLQREGELERICRYLPRPPLALHRLSRGEDGRLLYRMKRPKGGSPEWAEVSRAVTVARRRGPCAGDAGRAELALGGAGMKGPAAACSLRRAWARASIRR